MEVCNLITQETSLKFNSKFAILFLEGHTETMKNDGVVT